MISFRHHLLSVVAVFVALAVGVILGGGPLSELGRTDDATEPARQTDDGSATHAEYGDAFAETVGPQLYGDRLEGQQVSLLTLAGADPATVDGVVAQVEAAGGSVAARYEGREKLTVPGEQGYVDSLGTQLVEDNDLGDAIPSDLGSHERVGRLIGRAIASTEENGEESDVTSQAILDTLSSGELLTAPEEQAGRTPLVLVVLGEERTDAAATALLAGLAQGIGSAAVGEVVVGTTTSGEDGDLSLLRGEDVSGFTTVDGADTTVGQVTAAIALGAAVEGVLGSFGTSGADGAAPVG
ncbi:copper transporter [Nocardioides zeae]|uniref:Copper transporter n=1 Tax=Nocardioides imazamoxiresistens TaxID=3231893 RepID=A0ABU3PSS2_9ACTN|nr:copper transporter [Nocardioides zeae]MDT9592229.1 copper transporter [Nocardioides zeae]